MCATCGCSEGSGVTVTNMQTGQHVHLRAGGQAHGHEHSHEHPHTHEHGHEHRTMIPLEREILAKNDRLAERNRGWFEGRDIRSLNLMSSPGAGKTTLLERTIRELGTEMKICVIEGDQETTRDAERIRATGCSVIQINTGTACHLDADMIGHALRQLNPPPRSLVMIENVGNLVCPALFDLGEQAKVVVAAVTEGDDKPSKYPHMFRAADVIVLNKIDLLAHVDFQVSAFEQTVRQLNLDAPIFQVSATRGDGLKDWHEWLRKDEEKSRS